MILPEYGRIVHDLVELCVQMEDRDERNRFAGEIVEIMKSATQEKGKDPDEKKYWDHLYIISGRRLDIDSPFGVPNEEALTPSPKKIPYGSGHFDRRQYGNIVQKMIKKVALMDNSEEKDVYVELLANQLKKLQTMNNPENASDTHVFADISEISGGSIQLSEDIFTLLDFKEEKNNKNQKKKKNR